MPWFDQLRRYAPPSPGRGAHNPRRALLRRPICLANLRRLRGLLWAVIGINLVMGVLTVCTWESIRTFLGDDRLLGVLTIQRIVWIVLDVAALRIVGRQIAAPGPTSRLAAVLLAVLFVNMVLVVTLVLPLYPYYHTTSLYYVAIFAVVPLIRLDVGQSLAVLALPGLGLLLGILASDPLAPINLSNAVNLVAMTALSLISCRYLYAERMRDLLQREIIARQRAEVGRQALTDELTGLPNRRSLNACLDQEWRRAVRADADLAAIMADIDLFKEYNDMQGHAAGDGCLRLVAACLAGCLRRPGDMVGRYGGEEFTVVLPGVDAAGAMAVAERIRQEIAALDHPHGASPHGRLTVSLGVAARLRNGRDTPQHLLARADAALYAAKAAGRDTVRLAETQPTSTRTF